MDQDTQALQRGEKAEEVPQILGGSLLYLPLGQAVREPEQDKESRPNSGVWNECRSSSAASRSRPR